MKVIDILGGVKVTLSNHEDELYQKILSRDVNFSSLSDREKQIAFDLYFKNIVLIDNQGNIEANVIDDFVDINW